jgi:enoyl-CoA hydratase/carnithine racemase
VRQLDWLPPLHRFQSQAKETQLTQHLTVERARPGVFVIAIDRPERRNALNLEIKTGLAKLVETVDSDPSTRAIVITGGQDVFAAGTDLAEMETLTPTAHTLKTTDRVFTVIRNCAVPVVAAVEGYALGGGCELAMSCDLIVAAESSRFGQPEIRVGVIPGAGGTQRMVRIMGKYRALRLLLTGDQITAEEAYTIGLVSEVTPDGTALPRALQLAHSIASMPQLAVRAILELVAAGADAPLETALLLERKAFQLLFDSSDQKEGMRAFLERRSPEFRGE